MLKNYFKVAWRQIRNGSLLSALNIGGLATGLAFALAAGVYIRGELQVNAKLRNAARQYIIQSRWKQPGMGYELATLAPLAKRLQETAPQTVKNVYRFDGVSSNVSKGTAVFRENLQVGDSSLLAMYGFPVLQGNAATALNDPYSVVITETKARKYFGRTNVVGERLTIESFTGTRRDFQVSAVLKDLPLNSVTRLSRDADNQLFLSARALEFLGRNSLSDWNNSNVAGYIELQAGADPAKAEAQLAQILQRETPPVVAENLKPYLVPLTGYHLQKDNGLVRRMLWTLGIIAGFILLMAVINFVNLTIARSTARLREIGVRRVMGGNSRQLMTQFLVESLLLVALGALVALLLYSAGRGALGDILGRALPSVAQFPLPVVLWALGALAAVGLLAGAYPAFVLISFRTVESLKGKLPRVSDGILLRKTLVGFQFFTAAVVMTGALVVQRQVSHFFTGDLGYQKDYVLTAQLPRNWSAAGLRRMQTVARELTALPRVKAAALSWSIPDGAGMGTQPIFRKDQDSTSALPTEVMTTDEQYADAYGLQLKAGRFFSSLADTTQVVLNETAASAMGWTPAQAVGQPLVLWGSGELRVAGVVRDFHFGSMQAKIPPMTFVHSARWNMYRYLSLKLEPGNLAGTLEALQKKWAVLLPGAAFEYRFMDESLRRLYAAEQQLRQATQLATGLAVCIVLLGILGLVALSVQKRRKEIGIRKVLGASLPRVATLFLRDFVPVMLIGGLLAVPLAWYLLQGWLNDYAYRIPLTVAPFLWTLLLLSLLTVAVIVLQVLRAATASPATQLRTE